MDNRQSQRTGRINRIRGLLKIAKEQGKTISKEKLVADMSMHSGLARRTILEYITILITSGEAHEETVETGEVALVHGSDKSQERDTYIQKALKSVEADDEELA